MGRTSPCAAHLEEILEMVKKGYTRKRIGDHYGFSEILVRAFLERRGIRGVPPTTPHIKIDDQELQRMLSSGTTQLQAAIDLGVSQNTIERRVKRWGLQTARTGPRSGSGHPEWKTGRSLEKHGYVNIWIPMHPRARNSGRVAEHCLVKEVSLGRYLTRAEVVHHEDNHPRNNWPSNLLLFCSNADHLRYELTGKWASSPRGSIPGAYLNNQKIDRCPDEDETLAQCSSEIRQRLTWYIESHRPTNAHQNLSQREFLRTGAWREAFLPVSTE